jgi:hypothetical protein
MNASYSYSYQAPMSPAASMGMAVVEIAIAVLMIAAMWKIFTKAGQPGWAAIIPIYNIIVLLQVVGRPVWWIVLLLIPFVNIVIMIMIYNDLSKAFGKGIGTTLGLIVFPYIFFPILGFGKAAYMKPATAA